MQLRPLSQQVSFFFEAMFVRVVGCDRPIVTGLLYMAHLNSAVTHSNSTIIHAAIALDTTGQWLLLELSRKS